MAKHGASLYRSGCRCDVCRESHRAYAQARRAATREARLAAEAEGRVYIVEGITHGQHGYQYNNCRCLTCRLANAEKAVRYRARKKGAA